ncbi:MAG: helix-turn-helix transcriptional regulator, partial [Thermodesulfobacterium sp.]|nr:helix-turn-helix transcriptional regulator [Thermodesulfobacterium sp.]
MEILNIETNSIIKNMDIEKIIGENIKRFRKGKGFTKQDIAKILEVKWDTVNKWEKGIFKPGLDKLQKLAELFEVSLDDFLKPPAPEPFPGFNEVMELPV